MKNVKGITLIALIIIIIILLILAMVTIRILMSQGIIKHAQNATESYQIGEEKEKITLGYQDYKMDKLNKAASLSVDTANVDGNEDSGWTITFQAKPYHVYKLDKTGKITGPTTQTEQEVTDVAAIKMIVNSGEDGTVQIPISDQIECTIDWGDGNVTTASNKPKEIKYKKIASVGRVRLAVEMPISWDDGYNHQYTEKNKEYTVSISGNVKKMGVPVGRYNMLDYSTHQIMEITQWGETGLEEIKLDNCENLRKIATPSKDSFKNVTDFIRTFYGCTSLTSIPEGLFDHCPNVTSFEGTFLMPTDSAGSGGKLASIPAGLFDNCPNVTSFDLTFYGCESLTSIPEGLFDNCPNVTDFSNTFNGCTSLISIPEGLFDHCPNVTDFRGTFDVCTSLTSIPEGLFDNCPNVTDFGYTFCSCTGLTSIPEGLFDNCPNVTDFSSTFYGCTGLTGTAPELWKRGTNSAENSYKGNPCGHACFENCSGLENYINIPIYWKRY